MKENEKMENEKIIVNGKETTKEEFKKIQEEVSNNKKEKLKEVSPNNFKILKLMNG